MILPRYLNKEENENEKESLIMYVCLSDSAIFSS
ncbi:hypothetical protein LCGC14_1560000 [marine sediment metagenome]|uniref:Uncharacterized protein n=1 Tax=marine sediment metagenome TaxID=412755 RepID=A0A0F9LNH6_9ZZZZ